VGTNLWKPCVFRLSLRRAGRRGQDEVLPKNGGSKRRGAKGGAIHAKLRDYGEASEKRGGRRVSNAKYSKMGEEEVPERQSVKILKL